MDELWFDLHIIHDRTVRKRIDFQLYFLLFIGNAFYRHAAYSYCGSFACNNASLRSYFQSISDILETIHVKIGACWCRGSGHCASVLFIQCRFYFLVSDGGGSFWH